MKGQLALSKTENSKSEELISNLQAKLKSQSLERDSLELDSGDKNREVHLKTQISTLQNENSLARERLDHITGDFNALLDKVYKKR